MQNDTTGRYIEIEHPENVKFYIDGILIEDTSKVFVKYGRHSIFMTDDNNKNLRDTIIFRKENRKSKLSFDF